MQFVASKRRELAMGAAVLLFLVLGVRAVVHSLGQKTPTSVGAVQTEHSNIAVSPEPTAPPEDVGPEVAMA
jgi:hypothetical protein